MNANLMLWGLALAASGFAAWALLGLRRARRAAEAWPTRHEALQLELARANAEAEFLGPTARERDSLRERLEYLTAEKSRLETTADRVPTLERQVALLTTDVANLQASNSGLSAQMREQTQAHQDKIAALSDVKAGIESHLKAMAAEVLQSNQGTFLELANQAFEKHKVGADAELEARQKAVEALVTPLGDSLRTFQAQVDELERSRARDYGALSIGLKVVTEGQAAVHTVTANLVNALRASPTTRGRWGEQSLRNVLEMAGLSPHCDFTSEESFERADGRLRPDVIIRLPGGRHLVVDAKTSMSAYLDSLEATDDTDRERQLALHAVQLRAHMKQLSARAYWDGLTVTPDFVVMYVPGDNFWAAAIERDPSLFQDAAASRVVIATPSTLLALANSVAFGWRQEKVAENAQRVHELGRELYRRILVMTEHIHNCGGALGKSVQCFNQFIGSLEHSVMPQARRFHELEVSGAGGEIAPLEPIEIEPRLLRADRDFAGQLGVSANSNTDTERRPAA